MFQRVRLYVCLSMVVYVHALVCANYFGIPPTKDRFLSVIQFGWQLLYGEKCIAALVDI